MYGYDVVMKKKVLKPRNPLIVPLIQRSGGTHRKSNKTKRKGDKMQTMKTLFEGWNG